MAVFVAFSDEGLSNQSGLFHYSGLIAPELDWFRWFSPAWQERILDGPPVIPFLHMTDIRSKSWRNKYGITRSDADHRIDEAINIISTTGSIIPITVTIDTQMFYAATNELWIKTIDSPQFVKPYKLEPDYLCFFIYVFYALRETLSAYPNVEKIDFIVERKNKITSRFDDFYADFPSVLSYFGYPELIGLLGKLNRGDKDRAPLQAADVWTWYVERAEDKNLERGDIRRLFHLTNKIGIHHKVDKEFLDQLAQSLTKYQNQI